MEEMMSWNIMIEELQDIHAYSNVKSEGQSSLPISIIEGLCGKERIFSQLVSSPLFMGSTEREMVLN